LRTQSNTSLTYLSVVSLIIIEERYAIYNHLILFEHLLPWLNKHEYYMKARAN
jgi:hypothetical protein